MDATVPKRKRNRKTVTILYSEEAETNIVAYKKNWPHEQIDGKGSNYISSLMTEHRHSH
jgi:hypothetical protein